MAAITIPLIIFTSMLTIVAGGFGVLTSTFLDDAVEERNKHEVDAIIYKEENAQLTADSKHLLVKSAAIALAGMLGGAATLATL